MTTKTEVSIQADQFKDLIAALTADSDKLSVIVQNANDETLARARGDHENRAAIEYLAAEVRTIQESLETLYAFAMREIAEDGE